MTVEFFSNERARYDEPYIAVDAAGRIYLSKQAQQMLGCIESEPIYLYLGYDKVNKRIAIAKPDIVKLSDTKPFKFNAVRFYASAKTFLDKYGILPKNGSVHYLYDGMGHPAGTYLFRREGAVAEDETQKGAKTPKMFDNEKKDKGAK